MLEKFKWDTELSEKDTANHNTTNVTLVQADQICYAVLCVFSYVAAGQSAVPVGHTLACGSVSPRGRKYSDNAPK